MTESLVLAIAGTLVGLAVAYAAVSAGASLAPDLRMVLPRGGPEGGLTRVGLGLVGFDLRVLLFTVGMALATAVLFGLQVTAWRASRRDLTASMKTAVSSGSRGLALRNLLIVGEIALALVLLTAGGLMLKSVVRLQATEVGFNPDGLLTGAGDASRARSTTPSARRSFSPTWSNGWTVTPTSTRSPMAAALRYRAGATGQSPRFRAARRRPGRGPLVGVVWASPRYFDTLGIRVIRGRAFTESDRVGQPKVVGDQRDGGAGVLGKCQSTSASASGSDRAGSMMARRSWASPPTSATARSRPPCARTSTCRSCSRERASGFIFVRSRTAAEPLVAALRRDVQALDPNLPLTDIKTMDQRFDGDVAHPHERGPAGRVRGAGVSARGAGALRAHVAGGGAAPARARRAPGGARRDPRRHHAPDHRAGLRPRGGGHRRGRRARGPGDAAPHGAAVPGQARRILWSSGCWRWRSSGCRCSQGTCPHGARRAWTRSSPCARIETGTETRVNSQNGPTPKSQTDLFEPAG